MCGCRRASAEREQWLHVADRIENSSALTGRGGRSPSITTGSGERHLHIAWSRIDLEQMRAIDPGLYKNKLKEIAASSRRSLA